MPSADPPFDPAGPLRLLEGWLPLAQEASAGYGWRLDAPALAALIRAAAPALQHARTELAARAILWSTYQRLHAEHNQ